MEEASRQRQEALSPYAPGFTTGKAVQNHDANSDAASRQHRPKLPATSVLLQQKGRAVKTRTARLVRSPGRLICVDAGVVCDNQSSGWLAGNLGINGASDHLRVEPGWPSGFRVLREALAACEAMAGRSRPAVSAH